MYKIYLVEDDPGIADAITINLKKWDIEVRQTVNFHEVLLEFLQYAPHLVLMDIGLPFKNGYHWCSEIRRVSNVPVIFLSSASDNMNMVMAMNMGADDFIPKPFDFNVLVAKVQALLRRSYDYAGTMPMLEHKGAMLNTGDGTLTFGKKLITLSKNEYRILLILMQNKGQTVSREKLMEALWQTDEFVDENALTVNVGRLRKKLDAAGLTDFIGTKFGEGYIIL